MAAKRPKYSNILKHLKFKFKVVILTGCFICFYVCNYELFKFDIITQKQQAKQFKMAAKSPKWLPQSFKLGKIHQYIP